MACTFVVVGNLFVITIDGIPFILAHLAISKHCFGFCSHPHVFYNLVPLMGYRDHVSSRIHNLLLIDYFCAYNQSIQKSHLISNCHGDMNYFYLLSLFFLPLVTSINTTFVVLSISIVKIE